MKKLLTILCVSMLCVCCLAFTACGSSGSASELASESSASASSSSQSDAIVGEWKTMAVDFFENIGVGDFSRMEGSQVAMTLSFSEDGTVILGTKDGDDTYNWEMKDDSTIILTPFENDGSSSSASSANAEDSSSQSTSSSNSSRRNKLTLNYDGQTISLSLADFGVMAKAYFTKGEPYPGYELIDDANAETITSSDGLAGSYELVGFTALGITTYGDISSMLNIESMSMTLNEDGTGTFSMDGLTTNIFWIVDADGARINMNGGEFALKRFNDYLLMNTALVGDSGKGNFVFSK